MRYIVSFLIVLIAGCNDTSKNTFEDRIIQWARCFQTRTEKQDYCSDRESNNISIYIEIYKNMNRIVLSDMCERVSSNYKIRIKHDDFVLYVYGNEDLLRDLGLEVSNRESSNSNDNVDVHNYEETYIYDDRTGHTYCLDIPDDWSTDRNLTDSIAMMSCSLCP
jgi:hypothetical protein